MKENKSIQACKYVIVWNEMEELMNVYQNDWKLK